MSSAPARIGWRQARRSVRRKLIIVALVTTAVALAVSSTALLTRELHAYRTGLTSNLETEASILVLSTAPALAFDDHATADRNVKALAARPAVVAAAIYGAKGTLYASYVRRGARPLPPMLPRFAGRALVADGRIDVTQPVVVNGERMGTIYVRGRYDIDRQVYAYVGVIALAGLLSLGVALALSAYLQQSITKPLSVVGAIAQHVIAERDYSLRAPPAGDDEIGFLVEAFNSMLEEVQAADRRKDEFLATLAHELRNPLAPIRHAVKILEVPGLDDRRREWSREVIGRQVQRMALLLDDLLDVSRITRNRLELKITRVELSAVVRSAVEVARPMIDTKQQKLKINLPPQALELEADPLRLSQALSNLLTNAAKYTDPGGHIELAAHLLEEEFRFSVRDNGIGLTAAAIPKLFGMFSQAEAAIDRAEGGLGIGLALVKGLITLHGGSVEAQSEGPGRGSTFLIHLPRSIVAPPRDRVRFEASSPHPATAVCSVLIADDNRDAADTLSMLLATAGYRTCVAHSGGDALDLARREHPDVLILDIGMPDMTGYEVASRVRAEDWGRRALLIAATGWGQQTDKIRSAEAGFDHHLTKPVAPEAVEALLAEFAERLASRQAAWPQA